jgi:phosphoglycerate dehydrogenase-like enzyme
MPARLKMFEESQHQRRIELLQLDCRRGAAQSLAGELEQELKGKSVGIAGMGAGLSLVG